MPNPHCAPEHSADDIAASAEPPGGWRLGLVGRLLILILCVLVPPAGLEIHDQYSERNEKIHELHDQALGYVDRLAAEQSQIIDGIRTSMHMLQLSADLANGGASGCQQYLERLRPGFLPHVALLATDRAGRIICSMDTRTIGLSIGDRPHIRLAMQRGSFAIGGYDQHAIEGAPILSFGMPYRDKAGSVAGAIAAHMDLAWLEGHLISRTLPEGAAVLIADRDSTLLARAPAMPQVVGKRLPTRFVASLGSGRRGTAEIDGLDGADRIIAFQPLSVGEGALHLGVSLSTRGPIESINGETRRALAVYAAVLLAAIVAALMMGRRLVHAPLRAIIRVTERWRKGEDDARTGLRGRGSEIATLGAILDRMADDLRDRRKGERRAASLVDRVLEMLPVGVMLVAEDGPVLRANPVARLILGQAASGTERFVRHRLRRTGEESPIPAEEWPSRRAIERGEAILGEEYDLLTPDGSVTTLLVSAVPLREDDHAFSGAIVVVEDVTQRRVAEEATRLSDAQHRAIVDTAVDAMVVIDEQGVIRAFNLAAERIFGHTAEAAVGQNVNLLMPEPDHSLHDGYLARFRATGERRIIGVGREVEGLRKDGTRFPVELSIAEWRVGGKRFFTGIMRDITERRAAEHALHESRALLGALFAQIPDLISMKDIDGRYRLVNDALLRCAGLERESVIGRTAAEIFPADVSAGMEASDRRAIEHGASLRVEEDIPNQEIGATRRYATIKSPVRGADGSIVGLIAAARDITDSKLAEDDLRVAKMEADRANVSKSKFLAAASHDLRQPMQAMALFMGALEASAADQRSQRTIAAMRRSMDALRMLLDSILDVSKLDAGLIVARPIDLAVMPLLTRLHEEYAPRAAERRLELRLVPTRVTVRSDPALLERILRNYLENALRYTAQGGVLIGCRRRGDGAVITVVDTGIGIPAEQHQDIFEEFVQVGNLERDREKGLGLGLAIVRRLARLLGHNIELNSVPGRGSCFGIAAPLATPAEAMDPESTDPQSAPRAAGALVLVIDDEALVRLGMEAMLEGWGYRVTLAGSIKEAVRASAAEAPQAIIADYRLRDGETGIQAIRSVHRIAGLSIPAVIVTGDTAPERLTEAIEGGFRLLHKPVSSNELRQAVAAMLPQNATVGD